MSGAIKKSARNCDRRGATLILVLACSAVAVALVMLSIQISLQQRRHLRSEHQLEQTRWVLDAAIRKAIENPPDEAWENEVKPKLEKFDQALVSVVLDKDKRKVVVRAKIQNGAATSVTARSASFEITNE